MKYKKHIIVAGVVALITYLVYGLTESISRVYVDVSSGRIRTVDANRFFTYSDKIVDSPLTLEARRYGIEFQPERWVLTLYNDSTLLEKNLCSSTRNSRLHLEVTYFDGWIKVCDFKDSDERKRKFVELFMEWMRRGDYQDYEKSPSGIYEKCGTSRSRSAESSPPEERADATSPTANEIDPGEGYRRFIAAFLADFEESLYSEEETPAEP